MTAPRPFRWGVIAPGRIAHNFARALSVIDDAELAGVASRQPERAESFAGDYRRDHPGVQVYPDYDALIQAPDIDAVYIANPHRFHAEWVRACLHAGKPVLCEKPLAVTAREAAELFRLAQANRVFLMEALWSRFLPVWQDVRHWLRAGAIGPVHTVQSSFCFRVPFNPADRLWDIHQAGGVTLDMGVYPIALSNFIFERGPDRVQAAVLKGATDVDVRTSALLHYGEAVSAFTASFLAGRDNSLRIEGEGGVIDVDGPFWASTRATLTPLDGEPVRADHPHRMNGFEYQIEAAMADIRAGHLQNDVIPWADTLTTARVIDQILAEGGVVYPFL
ncbi:Gfo/Idh/MocA family protein [Marinobacter sp. JSM 1782161]|uniref:Gfo/Idh/MocA family protein n=1 Tax=Marinobacter sp. JSM 1782161 TaxID=2685906 RepID=UPI001403493D|nr:Gfo/Idh/MocA family oxidoreductase [Marinobacter sp. JSM 1782161]